MMEIYSVFCTFAAEKIYIKRLSMKKIIHLFLALAVVGNLFVACDDTETYAEMKEKERKAIEAYIESEGINVISFEQFCEQDSVTDTLKNEYVLFKDKGVYMQIVRKGEGEPLADGERAEINVRYIEMNIKDMDTLTGNIFDASNHDVMTIENKGGSYTGSFTSGYMLSAYGSPVPSGWMMPMPYIRLKFMLSGFPKVRLIVPHSEGQSKASSYVYPCFYEITYQKVR